jgi:hypothetical protein
MRFSIIVVVMFSKGIFSFYFNSGTMQDVNRERQHVGEINVLGVINCPRS